MRKGVGIVALDQLAAGECMSAIAHWGHLPQCASLHALGAAAGPCLLTHLLLPIRQPFEEDSEGQSKPSEDLAELVVGNYHLAPFKGNARDRQEQVRPQQCRGLGAAPGPQHRPCDPCRPGVPLNHKQQPRRPFASLQADLLVLTGAVVAVDMGTVAKGAQ